MDSSPIAVGQASHLCRAGHRCTGRTRDTETGTWTPDRSFLPNSLCDWCIRGVTAATEKLWSDHRALRRLIGEPAGCAGGEVRSSGAPTSCVPVNVHVDALMREIESATSRCAEAILDTLDSDPPTSDALVVSLQIVEPNIAVLLTVPPHDAMKWNRAGDDWEGIVTDGVQLALGLVDLHRRARAVIGVDEARDRMPVPCPRCESHQLGRTHGDVHITCLACGSRWTEDEYTQLTMFAATAFSDLAPRKD